MLFAVLSCVLLSCCPAPLCLQVYEGGQMAGAKLKPVDELQDVFEAAGVDVQAPLVCR